MPDLEPTLREALWRGLRRRCPRCGQGPLFRRWISLHERCSDCDLKLEGKPGDMWGFWVLTDRVFLFVAIVVLYLGFTPESWWLRASFFVLVGGAIVITMPQRQGAFVALDYLSRTRWRS